MNNQSIRCWSFAHAGLVRADTSCDDFCLWCSEVRTSYHIANRNNSRVCEVLSLVRYWKGARLAIWYSILWLTIWYSSDWNALVTGQVLDGGEACHLILLWLTIWYSSIIVKLSWNALVRYWKGARLALHVDRLSTHVLSAILCLAKVSWWWWWWYLPTYLHTDIWQWHQHIVDWYWLMLMLIVMLILMLMLILWPLAVTPGVTHFGAYHRPPDGHFFIDCNWEGW